MLAKEIFKKGSKTYFYSSLFFPKKTKEQVFVLYAFVRTADNYVDQTPQDKGGFLNFRKETENSLNGAKSENSIIQNFIDLCEEKKFEKTWVIAFLNSMEADLTKTSYANFSELETYIFGSANVIGLMMAIILNLPENSFFAAELLGKSFQLTNFLRDINEDISLGRTYFPQDEIKNFGLKELSKPNAEENPAKFKSFVNFQIDKILKIQKEAEIGFKFIPKKYLISVKTASDMYLWTLNQIRENPFVIFEKKVKPNKSFIIFSAIKNKFIL